MKRFAMALALACALSSVAFGGIVHSTDYVPPPPPPGETQTPPGITAPGDIPGVPLTVLLTILDFAF